ncbi:MAG TPA: hypothetical protein P5305_15625, partial [Rubrivivax sp.]|nr:hypothetical protein [Rubrivivax sp.]HRY89316.1 hypothetical protein [Rubrivivax sp.]
MIAMARGGQACARIGDAAKPAAAAASMPFGPGRPHPTPAARAGRLPCPLGQQRARYPRHRLAPELAADPAGGV